MQVSDVGIDAVKPYVRNAKIHSKVQVEQIAKSIEKFGWAQPLVIDAENTIVIGHGRYEAAKLLGLETVPCVVIDDLTEDEVRMLRLADNKLNEAPWDFEILGEELEGLDFGDLNLDFGVVETEEDDKYTDLVDIPQYEPSEGDVELSELVDTEKAEELMRDIEAAEISDEEKEFLRRAAARHFRFNYRRIADYYAGASSEVQELMERSALVLIDYEDAIKNGYARFRDDIRGCVQCVHLVISAVRKYQDLKGFEALRIYGAVVYRVWE